LLIAEIDRIARELVGLNGLPHAVGQIRAGFHDDGLAAGPVDTESELIVMHAKTAIAGLCKRVSESVASSVVSPLKIPNFPIESSITPSLPDSALSQHHYFNFRWQCCCKQEGQAECVQDIVDILKGASA
jgi:hypothetical protein